MDYTKMTLGMFLSAKDEVIRRNAQSILKQLQKNAGRGLPFWEECENCHMAMTNYIIKNGKTIFYCDNCEH
jgi:formamidopyrimidine-DNA glycosylase